MIGFGSITVSTINAVDETEIYYYQSSSPIDLADGSWSTTRPTWEDGKYVWQKTKTIYKDGTSSESQPVNITGQQGVGVSSVQRYYKMTDSLPVQPTDATISSWSTTEPQYVAGSTDNIYTVEKIVYADGTTSYSDVSLSASFVAAKQAYELANGVNDKVTSVYGTCSTPANTAKKEVVCAGFELYQGARIQVSFSYGNSASIPTLDVNNTGEKNIYLINTIINSSNQLYWTANAKIDFVYNGTGWVLQNIPVGLYGMCNSNSDIVAKEVTCGEAVICKGTYLSVLMNNNNTATAPTLNVASTVACAIKANNSTLTSNSIYNWRANFIQNFIFDGQYWIMCDDIAKYDSNEAKKEAINYLSIDNTGIMIADMSNGQRYLPSTVLSGIKNTFIDSDSFDVRDGQTVLASFGKVGQIGENNKNRMYISPDNMIGISRSNIEIFKISQYEKEVLSDSVKLTENSGYTSPQSTQDDRNTFVYFTTKVPKIDTEVRAEILCYDENFNQIGKGVISTNPEEAVDEYVYDTNGNIVRYYQNGLLYYTKKYDSLNRLIKYTQFQNYQGTFVNGNSFTYDELTTTYTYDGDSTTPSSTNVDGWTSVEAVWEPAYYGNFTEDEIPSYYIDPVPSGGDSATRHIRSAVYDESTHAFTVTTRLDVKYIQFIVTYTGTGMTTETIRYFTFGNRKDSLNVGNRSFVTGYNNTATGEDSFAGGYNNIASGNNSHAEGSSTKASGYNSHTEGLDTIANGNYTHAEGYGTLAYGSASHVEGRGTETHGSYAHAEGWDNSADGLASHVEGCDTEAYGNYSHAQNRGTIASSFAQTTLGRWNIEDEDDIYAVIIGNGSDDDNRSNVLAITWDGDTEFAFDTTASSGTIDANLYDAITALGWNMNDITV